MYVPWCDLLCWGGAIPTCGVIGSLLSAWRTSPYGLPLSHPRQQQQDIKHAFQTVGIMLQTLIATCGSITKWWQIITKPSFKWLSAADSRSLYWTFLPWRPFSTIGLVEVARCSMQVVLLVADKVLFNYWVRMLESKLPVGGTFWAFSVKESKVDGDKNFFPKICPGQGGRRLFPLAVISSGDYVIRGSRGCSWHGLWYDVIHFDVIMMSLWCHYDVNEM